MIYEDDVVRAVAAYLETKGWSITSIALATEHGDDIVATKDGRLLLVEAKGEGSSKAGSRRFGQQFTGGQVKVHVAVAVLRSLAVASAGNAAAAVAFPDNPAHRNVVTTIAPALGREFITVFWVSPGGAVTASQAV